MHAVGDAAVVIANVKNDVNSSSTGRGRIEIDTIVDLTDERRVQKCGAAVAQCVCLKHQITRE